MTKGSVHCNSLARIPDRHGRAFPSKFLVNTPVESKRDLVKRRFHDVGFHLGSYPAATELCMRVDSEAQGRHGVIQVPRDLGLVTLQEEGVGQIFSCDRMLGGTSLDLQNLTRLPHMQCPLDDKVLPSRGHPDYLCPPCAPPGRSPNLACSTRHCMLSRLPVCATREHLLSTLLLYYTHMRESGI